MVMVGRNLGAIWCWLRWSVTRIQQPCSSSSKILPSDIRLLSLNSPQECNSKALRTWGEPLRDSQVVRYRSAGQLQERTLVACCIPVTWYFPVALTGGQPYDPCSPHPRPRRHARELVHPFSVYLRSQTADSVLCWSSSGPGRFWSGCMERSHL